MTRSGRQRSTWLSGWSGREWLPWRPRIRATRARDLLVVPAVGDGPVECWLDALHPALYPPPDRAAVPITTTPPGCPSLRGDSVLERPGVVARPEGSVTPGLHAPASGSHEVVWWAPQGLDLDREENLGLRQQKLLQADEGGRRSSAGVHRPDAWQQARAALRARGESPRLVVATATERARAAAGDGEDIAIETVPAAAEPWLWKL